MLGEPRSPQRPDPLRALALALLALVLFSYVWLAPELQTRFVAGVPVVLLYLFGVWGALIVLAAASREEA